MTDWSRNGIPGTGPRAATRALVTLATVAAPALAAALAAPAELAGQQAFAQGVSYQIEARLDEDREVLRGRARITYENRSPNDIESLFFHQHLNAFRPNSEWARAERREHLDFQNLQDPDHAFERLLAVRRLPAGAGGSDIVGRDLRARWPLSPDSTVMEIPLLDVLEPGEAVTLEFDWEARPSTLCRRQCRAGRHYDFAQWYPRIAPYDEGGWAAHALYPQGEFYGEFGRYDVVIDVPEDQVIGATGAVVDGDPGWGVEPPALPSDLTPGERPRLGLLSLTPASGRKRVRFRADDVHHFAWTTSPDYMHEGGQVPATDARSRPVDIHVLYRPGDEEQWANGQAVASTVASLQFLEGVFGPYPWPQLTNVHRLEGGGTEFPMLIMDGSASQGLIMHETAHQYAHGIFGNNEWKDAWLDEGFASFLTDWAFEANQPGGWRAARDRMAGTEAAGFDQPISTVSEDFSSFGLYNYMAYTRGSFVYRMLWGLIGDEAFRAGLHRYYEREALSRVTEADFRAAMEEASGLDLGWFFDQWLHTTATLDYAVGAVETSETEGGYRVRVTVARHGDAWMPVTLGLVYDGEVTETVRLESRDRSQVQAIPVERLPEAVILDPDGWILDSNPGNDRAEVPAPNG